MSSLADIGFSQTEKPKQTSKQDQTDTPANNAQLTESFRQIFKQLNQAQRLGDKTEVGNSYLKIGNLYKQLGVPEQCRKWYEKAVSEFEISSFSDTLPFIYYELALICDSVGDIKGAKNYCNKILKNAASQKARKSSGQLSLKEIRAFNKQLDNDLALRAMVRLLNIVAEEKNDDELIEVNEEAIRMYMEDGKSEEIPAFLNNIGIAYMNSGKMIQAEEKFREAILKAESWPKLKDKSKLITYKINLANVLIRQKNLKAAKKELNLMLGIAQNNRNPGHESTINTLLSRIALSENDLMNAQIYCRHAVEKAELFWSPQIKKEAYQNRAAIMEKSGRFQDAINDLKKISDLLLEDLKHELRKSQDEMAKRVIANAAEKSWTNLFAQQEESSKQLMQLQELCEREDRRADSLQIQKERQENQNRILTLEKIASENGVRLSQEKLEREELEKITASLVYSTRLNQARREKEQQRLQLEGARREEQLKRKASEAKLGESKVREKQFFWIGILGVITLASVGFGFYQARKNNLRLKAGQRQIESANLALGSLNRQLTGKNNSITESIQYARGIQTAILPGETRWKEVFPDSFVFYLPKDIVSGDFYFLTTIGQCHIMAFADCTGHGVPGALMSIIGHNLLTSAIDIHGISKPAEILHFMGQGLQNTLRQNNQENHDGMEIGICSFDNESGMLEFAASRRPLFGIRNGEFFEWKGNRFLLGSKLSSDEEFITYSAPLSGITDLWMSSDGFQDQFGGPDMKKYSSGRLRNLLLANAGKNLTEQKESIEHAFEEWQGSNPQIDDVMLIGIRPASVNG
jgi:serine phosphatase RsbU (regulator of sigma subunit)